MNNRELILNGLLTYRFFSLESKTKNPQPTKTFFLLKLFILLSCLLTTNAIMSQTREFHFNNNATQEGFTTINSNNNCFQFRLAIKSMRLDSIVDNGYSGHRIGASGIFLPAEAGAPNIPNVCRYIAIPNGATARIEIIGSSSQTIENVDLMAAPPILLETDTTHATYEKDSSIYGIDAFYPAQIASVSDTFSIRGINTIAVSVSPYQYNPVTKKLVVYHDLSISVSFVGGNGQYGETRLRSPYWDPILMQNLVNYDQLPVVDYEARMDDWVNSRPTGCEYLIVIPNNESFRPYANQLKEYRIKQGILTDVKSLGEMNCSDTTDMKNYFHYAYNHWDIPPVAICLFGDHNENISLGIPVIMKSEKREGTDPRAYATDNIYADVDGDGLPEMVFSRLVAASPSEAQMLVNKQIGYEYTSPIMAANYYDQPITSTCWCTEDWYQLCTEIIGGYWRTRGKHPVRINELNSPADIPGNMWSSNANSYYLVNYFGPDGLNYIPSTPNNLGGWTGGTGNDIVTAVNSGSMILFHRDHGEVCCWEKPSFDQNQFMWLDNDEKLTFVVSVDCETGMFNFSDFNCLVESFLRTTSWQNSLPAGAVGCIAPTRVSYSFVNDVYSLGLFDFFTPQFMPDLGTTASYDDNWLPAFGNVAGKIFLSQNNWASNSWRKPITYDIYTAHCDAFLRLYSEVPAEMNVVHPIHIDMNQGRCHVTAPEGATVALTTGNNILKVITATGEPQIIDFPPQPSNAVIDLVTTKQNHLRYVAQITNESPCIVGYSSIELSDCDEYPYELQIEAPGSYTYDWQCSSNLQIEHSSGNAVIVKPIGIGNGIINVDVYFNGLLYTHYSKNVNVTSSFTPINYAPISINTNTTWSANNLLLQYSATVEAGAVLTITGTVTCLPNTSIIVKPKGRLIISGGHLKGICEEEWNGIQVWGDRSKHQAMENGVYWQGYLELKNGATIENAFVGIDVWKPNDYTTTGGIVKATNASFINNTRAVHFHPYENQFENPNQSGVMVVNNNVSRFKNCTFSVGSDYNGPGEFVDHVRLDVVRGVRFEGCSFTFVDNLYSNSWPMGLYAYNAGFNLRESCASSDYLPCQNPSRSTFDGFHKAVVSVNDGSVGTRPAFVRNTDFTNNNFGVFAVRSGFATVLNSTFGIGKRRNRCAAGIFVESTPNFTIEQDTFGLAQQYPEENYGVVVKDSKSQNLIYGNVFKGLHCANLSDGRNNTWLMPRETSGAKADILGLEYCCNDNTGNLCDFYVLGGSSVYVLGMQTNQGKQYAPANNTFSQGSAFQFTNHGNNGVNYYHDPNLPGGTPSGILGVTLVPTADTTGCPSHYDGNGTYVDSGMDLVLTDAQRRQREEDYGRAYAAYNAIRAIYDSRIDGGDTDAEIADVVSATPADMWDLRARLLGHSPYLTKGVLTAVADKSDVFPQSVLFEILASNPDELKSDSLMSYLGNMDQPLPDYMIALLRQIADGTSARTAMESEMARCVQEFRLAAGDIVRSILADTVVDKAELVRWLGNMEDMETDREIVGVYLEDGRYDDALALAGMFPTLYGLAGEDLEEHNDYMALLNLYGGSLGSGRNTMQLDSVERATVEHIADYGTGTPQAMAKALLMGAYGYRYNDCPVGVDLTLANTGRSLAPDPSSEDLNRAMGFSVTVAPNPASTWVAIDYSLPPGASKAQMTITNALGMTVAAYDLSGNASQKVLDLRNLADGVYAYTVYCGKLSQTGKLAIVK